MANGAHPPKPQSHERTCCGVIEEAAEHAREKRYNRTKPQPWIVRKLMVGVTTGIIGYAGYVYIQRLCVPMVRGERRAQAGRSTGSECPRDYRRTDISILMSCSRTFGCFLCPLSLVIVVIHQGMAIFLSSHHVLNVFQIVVTPPGYARDVSFRHFLSRCQSNQVQSTYRNQSSL